MSGEAQDDGFLKRWSRRKLEAREREALPQPGTTDAVAPAAPAPADEGAAPPLPPVESLGMDSDFTPFLHPKVEEHVRRAALKKLFSDPRFNAMDGLDVYIDDYSVSEPLSEAMLGQLEQAKKILAWSREDAEARAAAEAKRSELARQDAEGPRPAERDVDERPAQCPAGQDGALPRSDAGQAPDAAPAHVAARPPKPEPAR